jgi:hypothetical protein
MFVISDVRVICLFVITHFNAIFFNFRDNFEEYGSNHVPGKSAYPSSDIAQPKRCRFLYKVKQPPFLCLTDHHVSKTQRSGDVAPLILNFGSRWQ